MERLNMDDLPPFPDDATLEVMRRKILEHPAYRLSEADAEFLAEEPLRGVRLELEYMKPHMVMRQHRVRSTVVVFGSARILPPEKSRARLEAVQKELQALEDDPAAGHSEVLAMRRRELHTAVREAERQVHYSVYYTQARRFAQLVSCQFQSQAQRDYVVITGGGPGIMMAANQGAHDVGCESIGLNITLPHEQEPNPFMTPALAFRFHYFALRKMHFLLRAKALVAFPGGFGTLDELMEALTLVQTGKMEPVPILLFGREFWQRLIDFDFLVNEGMISPQDASLFSFVESAEEAVAVLERHYGHAFENNHAG